MPELIAHDVTATDRLVEHSLVHHGGDNGAALYTATADLHRLNPNPGPDPAALHARFLGWVRPRP